MQFLFKLTDYLFWITHPTKVVGCVIQIRNHAIPRFYRLSDMINKDVVKRRLEVAAKNAGDPNAGISLQEFMYQAIQAYDWLHLSQKYDCYVQLGGNDQLGKLFLKYIIN